MVASNVHLKIFFKTTDKIMKKYHPVDFPRVPASLPYRIELISVKCVSVFVYQKCVCQIVFQIESKIERRGFTANHY